MSFTGFSSRTASFTRPLTGLCLCLSVGVSFGCADGDDPADDIRVTTQHVRGGASPEGDTYVGMNMLITDAQGEPVSCADGELSVSVTLHSASGTSQLDPEGLTIGCADSPTELSLVVDNSGSEEEHLDLIAESAKRLTTSVIDAGGGAALVRVSTESRVVQPLTSSVEEMDQALDGLFVNKGWTALYDGIRVANEALGAGQQAAASVGDAQAFCTTTPRRAIVVLTDGYENNSANQYANESYPGDGIDTSLEDLKTLKVNGAGTSIYPLGMGKYVDDAALEGLAEATGGRYRKVGSLEELPSVFDLVGHYVGPSVQICGDISAGHCGAVTVEIEYTWKDGDREITGSTTREIEVACEPPAAAGRVATTLMTMTNPGIPAAEGSVLARDLVAWVSPVPEPRVLVVRDDNHQAEFPSDSTAIANWLGAAGYDVTFADEPAHGIEAAQLDGYDVVWFSNPGYPMDDQGSFMALQEFNGAGGGVVLQGDDMSWSWGSAFSMSPLTRLEFQSNGTSFCGHAVDDNRHNGRYRVAIADHPATHGVAGRTWLYGDDIDTSQPLGVGEEVLAWADLTNKNGKQVLCGSRVPVIVVYDPR